MARNFRGLKISRFSQIRHEPRKSENFALKIFLLTRTAHTHPAHGATCQHMTFLVYFAQLLCHYGSLLIFSSFGEI